LSRIAKDKSIEWLLKYLRANQHLNQEEIVTNALKDDDAKLSNFNRALLTDKMQHYKVYTRAMEMLADINELANKKSSAIPTDVQKNVTEAIARINSGKPPMSITL